MSEWYDEIPGEVPGGGPSVAEKPAQKNWYDDIPGTMPRRWVDESPVADSPDRLPVPFDRILPKNPKAMPIPKTDVLTKAFDVMQNLQNAGYALDVLRSIPKERHGEFLDAAQVAAEQLKKDRPGFGLRMLMAPGAGVEKMANSIQEFVGLGGSDEEIALIDRLRGIAQETTALAQATDPWYTRLPVQVGEMAPQIGLAGKGIAGLGAAFGLPRAQDLYRRAKAEGGSTLEAMASGAAGGVTETAVFAFNPFKFIKAIPEGTLKLFGGPGALANHIAEVGANIGLNVGKGSVLMGTAEGLAELNAQLTKGLGGRGTPDLLEPLSKAWEAGVEAAPLMGFIHGGEALLSRAGASPQLTSERWSSIKDKVASGKAPSRSDGRALGLTPEEAKNEGRRTEAVKRMMQAEADLAQQRWYADNRQEVDERVAQWDRYQEKKRDIPTQQQPPGSLDALAESLPNVEDQAKTPGHPAGRSRIRAERIQETAPPDASGGPRVEAEVSQGSEPGGGPGVPGGGQEGGQVPGAEAQRQASGLTFTTDGNYRVARIGDREIGSSTLSPADPTQVEQAFPGVTGVSSVRQLDGIIIPDLADRGQGHGKAMMLDNLAQDPSGWLYSSQMDLPAVLVLRKLAQQGLVEVHWKRQIAQEGRSIEGREGPPPPTELGPWMARLTDKGRALVKAQETPTAPEPVPGPSGTPGEPVSEGALKRPLRKAKPILRGLPESPGGEPPPSPPGGASGTTPTPLPGPETTGTRNAKTDELRAASSLPERPPPLPDTIQDWHRRAADAVIQDPGYAKALVDVLKDRAPDMATIEGIVGQRIAALEQQRKAGNGDIGEIQKAVQAAESLGTMWGRQGVARQVELADDNSLPGLMRRATRGSDQSVTPEEGESLARSADRISALQDAANAELAGHSDVAAQKRADVAIDDMIAEAKRARKTATQRERRRGQYREQVDRQYETAQRHGVNAKDLRDVAEQLAETRAGDDRRYNDALRAAEKATGLTRETIEAMREKGKDPVADTPGLDETAPIVAREQSDLGLQAESADVEQRGNYPEEIVRLISEGKRPVTQWHDQAILDEAGKQLSAEARAKGGVGDAWEGEPTGPAPVAAKPPKAGTRIPGKAERFDTWWEGQVEAAKGRLKSIMRGERPFSSISGIIDPQALLDLSVIGADYIKRGATEFGKWSARLLKEFGEEIRPHLAAVWDASQKRWGGAQEQFKKGSPEEQIDKQIQGMQKRFTKAGKFTSASVKKLARAIIDSGITDRDEVAQAVHDHLLAIDPSITREETHDLISTRGMVRQPKQDKTSRILTDISRQLALIENIKGMQRDPAEAPLGMGFKKQEPSDAERQLRQEFEREKKRHPEFRARGANQLRGAIQAAERAVRNRLIDLGKEVEQRKAVAEARKRLSDLRGQEPDQQRMGLISELEQQIQQIESGLARKPAKPLTSKQLEADRARLKSLKSQRDELRKLDPQFQGEEYDRWIATRERQLTQRLADIQASNAKMEQTGKLPEKPVRKERKPSDRLLQLEMQIADAKKEASALVDRIKWNNLSKLQKTLKGTGYAFQGVKSLWASLDLSFIGRQGFSLAMSHPIMAMKAQGRSIKAFVSDAEAFKIQKEVMEDPFVKDGIAKRMGLDLTEMDGTAARREELYAVHWPEHIPVIGRGVRASERAFVAQGNQQRLGAAKAMVSALLRKGPAEATDAELQIIGHYINAASWRGDVGRFEQAAVMLNNVFWTPRGYVGQFQYLLGTGLWAKNMGKGTWRVRKVVAMEYARGLAGRALFYSTAAAFLYATIGPPSDDENTGWSLNWYNPYDMDYGKLRIGRRRIDVMGGLAQMTRFGFRYTTDIVNGVRQMFGAELSEASQKELDVSGSAAGRFLASKIAPIPSLMREVASGKTYEGEPLTPGKFVAGLVTPLSFRDIYESMTEFGVPGGVALSTLAIFGFGGMTYKETPKKLRKLRKGPGLKNLPRP